MNGRIDSGLGQIVIDTDVIATYAGSVAVECFGIIGMAAISMKDGLVKLLRIDSLKHGISVKITDDNKIRLNFHVIVAYGVNISTIADNLVNNVKYNFGTQYYDDFTMRMYGKNTLYDLANGGGKSVLMLLLMQNMIPNCTLDEKQPIEKLFRTGNGNTTIHSLVEWKLDEQDRKEGYRYMTTGFCARKAKDVEGETAKKDVAAIEYFNYCIFYREYNKNDIINLPLSKDKERITFQGLRNYLKELEHRDMSLKVCIFDRKGEYRMLTGGTASCCTCGMRASGRSSEESIRPRGMCVPTSRRIIRRRERSWRIC